MPLPSIIDQIREQQAWEQPKKSSSFGFIAGTIAAFAAGIVLVMSWSSLPSLSTRGVSASSQQANATMPAKPIEISIPTGGRIGTASRSKLLRTCAPASMMGFAGGPDNSPMDEKYIYQLLQAANSAMTIAAMAGQGNAMGGGAKAFASIWGEVADCVFRQNGWNLCDPDNRALAVESVSAFVKQSALAAAAPEKNSEFNKVAATLQGAQRQRMEQAMYQVRATRERVLSTLKIRAQEGRFIASDFGFFAPSEVSQILRDAKPTSDGCASKS
jgi:hypothetical protein